MDDQKVYHCSHKGCNSSFNRPYRLTLHLLAHNNIKAYVCSEKNCSKSYTNKSHLDRHVNTVHKKIEDDLIYSCPICMKRYANRQNLKRHMKRHNLLKSTLTCDVCSMEFRKKSQLHAHMYIHTGVKAFSCNLCTNTYKNQYEKKRHMRVHKLYNCDKCNMTFNHWSKYQKHRKTDHQIGEYICDECKRSFKQRVHIVRHIKTHANDTKKVFPCPYENCQRSYSRNSNLRQHVLINHLKIKHDCPTCGAQLSTKAKLKHHLKLHDKSETEKPLPKTLATGRKERKDKGSTKTSTALILSGIPTSCQLKLHM